MKMSDMYPSKYVKAADLNGKEPTVLISRVEMESLGDETKPVIYFQGTQKGLVCNRTNADRIAYLYGDDTDGWLGKEITLFTELVNFQGKVGPAIRVRPPTKREPVGNGRELHVQDRGTHKLSSVAAAIVPDVPSDEIPF